MRREERRKKRKHGREREEKEEELENDYVLMRKIAALRIMVMCKEKEIKLACNMGRRFISACIKFSSC